MEHWLQRATLDIVRERYCIAIVEIAPEHGATRLIEGQGCRCICVRRNGQHTSVYESLSFKQGHLTLQVPFADKNAFHEDTWQRAQKFQLLETNNCKLDAKFYSVVQINLEHIFVDFCRARSSLM